jgi:hypothetical protein
MDKEEKMKLRLANLMGIVLLLSLTLQACGTASATPAASVPQPTEPQPTDTLPAPTVEVATSAPTQLPVPTQIPEPTKIQHITKPGEPSYIPEQTTIDCTIGRTYVSDLPVVIPSQCDNPILSFIERPVTADTKDYLPYLDIGQAQFGGNVDWIYARINVYDTVKPTGAGDLYYFFKLDLNLDGRNSNVILVSVKNLPLDAFIWTVNGVQAWSDVEGTISPVFDQGVGSDPDLIWARRSPKAIEMAFKPALLNDPVRFAWTAWNYQGTLTPTDIAFSSDASEQYQIDNTCAWGFNASAYALTNHCIK